jgi:uncharacterized protein (TIGR02246 family)
MDGQVVMGYNNNYAREFNATERREAATLRTDTTWGGLVMSKNRSRGTTPFVTAVLLLAPLFGSAADSDAVQKLIDKAEIDTLLVRYTHALDTLDPDKYASVFTADAVFEQGQGRVRHGRGEIRSIITELLASRKEREQAGTATPGLMHHVMTNATLEFVNDHEAHHYAYWMTIIGGEDGYRVAAMGHYEDVIVKQGDQWLIQNRKLLR